MFTAALLLLAAQAPLALVELGRTQAVGGEVRRCAFDRDGRRMLTVGDRGDFAFWDLESLTVLASHPRLARFVTAAALHPTEPWALVACTPGEAKGSVWRLGLGDSKAERLFDGAPGAIVFDRQGQRCAVVGTTTTRAIVVDLYPTAALRAGAVPEHRVVSGAFPVEHVVFGPDGTSLFVSVLTPRQQHLRIDVASGAHAFGEGSVAAVTADGAILTIRGTREASSISPDGFTEAHVHGVDAQRSATRVTRLRPVHAGWDCEPYTDTWLDRPWAGPGGLVVAPDVQGQVHVLGPEPGRRRLAAAHETRATGLVWSHDSRFLAVQSTGALRIVDRNGQKRVELAGVHGAVAGPGPSTFTLANAAGLCDLDAATGAVGALLPFRGGQPDLVISAWDRGDGLFGVAPMARWLDGLVFAGGRHPCRSTLVRSTSHALVTEFAGNLFQADALPRQTVCLLPDPHTARVYAAEAAVPMGCVTFYDLSVQGVLRVLSMEGVELAGATFERGIRWLVPAGPDHLLVGLGNGTVSRRRTDTLAEEGRWETDTPLLWCCALDAQRALTGDGRRIWVMALDDVTRRAEVRPPAGMGEVKRAALAPDRVHLALASDAAVVITAID